jgi:hypothetical protein
MGPASALPSVHMVEPVMAFLPQLPLGPEPFDLDPSRILALVNEQIGGRLGEAVGPHKAGRPVGVRPGQGGGLSRVQDLADPPAQSPQYRCSRHGSP